MYVLTYNLREDLKDSDSYYRTAGSFAEEVVKQASELAGSIIEDYRRYALTAKGVVCSREEYILEFLVLGTLWQVYSGDALDLEKIPQRILAGLVRLRRQGGALKPGIDFLRGIFSTLFLSPDLYDNLDLPDPSMTHFDKLLSWLSAAGEFDQEVKRLEGWRAFLSQKPQDEACDILATALTLAAWFQVRSEEVLGRYTPCVERFLNELRPERYWNEDVIFCGRRRVEYHLNMVGAEIMNKAFRDSFLEAERKLVLLPVCMRLKPESECRARRAGRVLHCTGCTGDCSVNKITGLGKMYDYDTIIVPHGSTLTRNDSSDRLIPEGTGAIGVACVLNLISGGWLLMEMGIPAQCVLLDYCGCKTHWHKEGMPTEININRLIQILGIDGR